MSATHRNKRRQRSGLTYEIRTLDDFKGVPPRRLAACLREFRLAVLVHRSMESLVNAGGAERAKRGEGKWPASGIAFKPLVFRWTDDDEKKIDVQLRSPVPADPSTAQGDAK